MSAALSDVTEFIIDTKHKTPKYVENGYPCIRTPNIGRGYFILDNARYVSQETYEDWAERAVPRTGDLILAREAPVGNVAWIPPGLRPCIGQRTVLIRPLPGIVDSRYLSYLLLGDECQNRMHALSGGATVPHLNMSDIRKLELPQLPPLAVQHRVAAILSAYDDLIENNLRRIKILEEMAQNLYREWFVKFRFPGHEQVRMADSPLGKIPEGWDVVPMEDVCARITDGAHRSPKSVESGYPMASVKDMHDWGINVRTCRTISEEEFRNLERNDCKMRKDDVLIAKDGSYLKHCFVVEKDLDVALLSSIAMLRPNDRIRPHVLAMTLLEPDVKTRMKGYVSGAALPRIILKEFRKFQVVLAPKEIQNAWAAIAEPMIELCWRLIEKNNNLRQTRDLLLPKLISGELDVSSLPIAVPEEAA